MIFTDLHCTPFDREPTPGPGTYLVRLARPGEAGRLFDIWASAVDATHDFLSGSDRQAIEPEVLEYVRSAKLWVAVDQSDEPIGFVGLTGNKIDSLFVHGDRRGLNVGRTLVRHAATLAGQLLVDVNEQNEQAIGFYARLGFTTIGRSPLDDQGRPYPLFHLSLGGAD